MPTAEKKKPVRKKFAEPKELAFKAFEQHGVVEETSVDSDRGRQMICSCPFCQKEKGFYVNEETGQFDCKSCGKKGNKYTFLHYLYEAAKKGTRASHLKKVSAARQGIPAEAYDDVAYDRVQNCYLIPYHNEKGTLVNLGRWSGAKGTPIAKTATCKLHLQGLPSLESTGPIYLVEGEWDRYALRWLLQKTKKKDGSPFTVLASPGASVWDDKWLPLFEGREVVVVGDFDDPGRQGVDKKISALHRTTVKSLRVVEWPESLPEGYDVEDYVAAMMDDPKEAVREFEKLSKPVSTLTGPQEETQPIETFKELVKEYQKHIHLSKEMIDLLAVMFAVTFSSRDEQVPLWLFAVGAPGSGKTLLLQSFGNTHWTHFESALGPKSLVSGASLDYDPSLLPRLIGRTLIVKDWTEILTMNSSDQDQILSVLRGVYDGRYERQFGNGQVRIYPDPSSPHKTCYFSILAGVTHAIYKSSTVDYGERFLRFELKTRNVDDHIRRALKNVKEKVSPEFALRPIANAFLAREVDPKNLPAIAPYIEERLVGLSKIISYVRSRVERHQGRLVYRPILEFPTRLAMQLLRLGQFLAFTLNRPSFDKECYRLVLKVALDTCLGWNRDVFLEMMKHPHGITREEMGRLAHIEATQVHRCLNDMVDLGAFRRQKMPKSQKAEEGRGSGNTPFLYFLSKEAKEAIEKSKLKEGV